MTTQTSSSETRICPVQALLKLLSGKWKPEIFRLAVDGPVRFNELLRQLKGSNKQTVSVALRELEMEGIIKKNVVKYKPLHIEYNLTQRGSSFISVLGQLEVLINV
jgi:DNA-binding HxlR family transcriptional regulator